MNEHQDIRQNTETPDDALKWKPVSTEHVVQDKWIDFRRMAFELPDGTVFSPYYNFSRRSYVVIVASDEADRYLCVRQYRHGIGEVTTEFVAGGIECDTDREYLTDNYAFIYRARNCQRTHEQHTDSTEFLCMERLSASEIEALIAAGKFQQAVHVMAWLLSQR